MIKVVIVEDHHMVREAIKALLNNEPDIEVIGEAADGYEAVKIITQLKPDVAIIDIAMPRLNGNEAIRRITALGIPTRMLALSMHLDPALIRAAYRNGAKAYLSKQSVSQELLIAIKAAYHDQNYLSPGISSLITEDILKTDDAPEQQLANLLTPREIEVLQLIAEGHGNNSIALILNISTKTVEKHKFNIMNKLKMNQTAGLVKVALKHGLIFLEEKFV